MLVFNTCVRMVRRGDKENEGTGEITCSKYESVSSRIMVINRVRMSEYGQAIYEELISK